MPEIVDLVTAREAARILGRSVSSVHRFRSEGRLVEAAKFGGLRGPVVFRRSDVEELAAQLNDRGAA